LALSGKFSAHSVQVTDYVYTYATASIYLITHLRMDKVQIFFEHQKRIKGAFTKKL